jgi:hypothetical protein
VAHTYNPSYSGGRDQEDNSLKPALGNNSCEPISKNPITKKKKNGQAEWLKVKALISSPSMAKKKKKRRPKDSNKKLTNTPYTIINIKKLEP